MPIIQSVQKAEHSFQFAVSDLREALKQATPVEAIVLMSMIKRAADLENEAKALHAAMLGH